MSLHYKLVPVQYRGFKYGLQTMGIISQKYLTFEYEYKIDYEYDFLSLVCRLHITHPSFSWATLST